MKSIFASAISQPSLITSFFFNDTATTEIYTLSLHDALPISGSCCPTAGPHRRPRGWGCSTSRGSPARSEEHTSELQSRQYLVCRLLLEKKNTDEIALHVCDQSAERADHARTARDHHTGDAEL